MAWTTPASYAVSEVLAAAKLNTHLRDNLRYLKGLDGAVVTQATTRVETAQPETVWKETGGAADAKVWRFYATGGTFVGSALNDAESAESAWLYVTRTGAAVTGITLNQTTAVADVVTVRAGASTLAGVWMETSGAVKRAYMGLTAGAVSPWRVFSSALGGDILTLSLSTGDAALAGSLQVAGGCRVTATANLTLDAAAGSAIVVGTNATDVHPQTNGGPSMGTTGNRWSGLWTTAGAINTSSREVKQDIRPFPPDEAAALLRRTDFVRFRYRRHPELERVGFIAEDTDRTLSLDGKSAEPQTSASVVGAAWQEHDARLAALDARLQKLEGVNQCPE